MGWPGVGRSEEPGCHIGNRVLHSVCGRQIVCRKPSGQIGKRSGGIVHRNPPILSSACRVDAVKSMGSLSANSSEASTGL